MALLKVADLLDIASQCFTDAQEAADEINLSAMAESEHHYGRKNAADVQHISSRPKLSKVKTFHGLRGWATLLCFDLRRSTRRALELGPRDTYLTMHTYLPTMLELVGRGGGQVVGLRGDGAIACFGLVELDGPDAAPTKEQREEALRQAARCGTGMVEAIDAVVNRVLEANKVKGGLQIGVGIDVGNIVATNIGRGGATELTAYGNCVNGCCKNSDGNNSVVLSLDAKKQFPKSPTGRADFKRFRDRDDSFLLRYPSDYRTLS